MILLLFLIALIQFFNFWIFEPFAFFLGYILEIRIFPIIALFSLILLFSGKNIEQN